MLNFMFENIYAILAIFAIVVLALVILYDFTHIFWGRSIVVKAYDWLLLIHTPLSIILGMLGCGWIGSFIGIAIPILAVLILLAFNFI